MVSGSKGSNDAATPPRAPTVLVVDDHADTREMYVEFLEAFGMKALSARTCAEAFEKAAQGIDAVVLDRRLPDGDGKDVCNALKPRGVVVIMLSGQDKDRSIDADAYLLKPVVPETLVQELERLLARRGRA